MGENLIFSSSYTLILRIGLTRNQILNFIKFRFQKKLYVGIQIILNLAETYVIASFRNIPCFKNFGKLSGKYLCWSLVLLTCKPYYQQILKFFKIFRTAILLNTCKSGSEWVRAVGYIDQAIPGFINTSLQGELFQRSLSC